MPTKSRQGFTLIELLVTMALIGTLSTLVVNSFSGARRGARDAQRRNDIKQYSTAVETFAIRNNGFYPAEANTVSAEGDLCSDINLTGVCVADPTNTGLFGYKYQSNGTTGNGAATATKYVLWAYLDKTSEYFVVCSNGETGTIASLTVTGGNCPI